VSSRRQRILEVMKGRLETIQVVDGFQTDAGQHVLLGELPEFGPADPAQAIALIPGEDVVNPHLSNIPIEWPLNICALVPARVRESWKDIEAMLADIKQAVELEDRLLGGLLVEGRSRLGLFRGTTETLERRSGSEFVGAVITYVAPYVEAWGHPNA